MERSKNPYAPGAGQRPPELAGREAELAAFTTLLDRLEGGLPERGIMLTGLRGVGKTVLLETLLDSATQRGCLVGLVEADQRRSFRYAAARALRDALRSRSVRGRLSGTLRRALGTLRSFSVTATPEGSLTLGVNIEPEPGRADSGDLELDLIDLLNDMGEAAAQLGTAVLLLVDELQVLPDDQLAAVAGATHHVNRRGLPVAVVGAGLPHLKRRLTEVKTYSERLYSYRQVGTLDVVSARRALTKPVENLNVEWRSEALDAVVDEAAGYAYFLQSFGKAVWDSASGARISADEAAIGIGVAKEDLDFSFFGSRWERATPAQQHYMQAMVQAAYAHTSGDTASGSEEGATNVVPLRFAAPVAVASMDVARLLGTSPGRHRKGLIDKGLIYVPSRGQVAFTVPGMASFIQRVTAAESP